MFSPKNILVPTDFSEYSTKALKRAVDMAQQYKAKIYLLHVIDEAIHLCAVDYCLSDDVVKALEKGSFDASKDKLQQEVKALTDAQNVEIVFDVKKGVPSEVILEEEREKGIDLVVIASHGKTGLLKYLIGSVTEKVVRGSSCPVMVVRP
jgi:universal stress protein A